jgi:hypothetical protein
LWSNVHKLQNRFHLKYPTAKAVPTRKSQTTLRAWLCSHNIVTNDLFYRICGFNFDAKTCWWSVPPVAHIHHNYQRLMNFWRLLLVLFKFRLVQTCPKWPWKYSQACAIISALKRSASIIGSLKFVFSKKATQIANLYRRFDTKAVLSVREHLT